MTIDAMRAPALDSAPWYRQRWPWLLIAGPAIVVVAGIFTAWLAAATDDGIIADDYYRRGLMINKELERTTRAEQMKLGAILRVARDHAVRLEMSGFADAATAPATVLLTLTHPTRAGQDRAVTLTRGADGIYTGTLVAPAPGRWHVTVETASWRLPVAVVNGKLDDVRVGAARAVD
jgi:hypothetical protein